MSNVVRNAVPYDRLAWASLPDLNLFGTIGGNTGVPESVLLTTIQDIPADILPLNFAAVTLLSGSKVLFTRSADGFITTNSQLAFTMVPNGNQQIGQRTATFTLDMVDSTVWDTLLSATPQFQPNYPTGTYALSAFAAGYVHYTNPSTDFPIGLTPICPVHQHWTAAYSTTVPSFSNLYMQFEVNFPSTDWPANGEGQSYNCVAGPSGGYRIDSAFQPNIFPMQPY